jgi:cysteinyl-tRNA synthetase
MKIYSTISREKERLETIHSGRINLFVCGPTVYDDSHIGHARTYIAFDVVARYLKHRGYSVFYLQNITDVDDKIINRAAERGLSPRSMARKFEQRYLEDMLALGVTNVNYYARATEHMPEIISQIERLMEKGFAYETDTGVYFDESLFPDFGKLSHQSAEELKKHRIEPDPTKRNSGDFALWKKRPEGEGSSGHDNQDDQFDEEVVWDSPWGKGRPGWHIEDTAITETYFGPQYDIHGGAMDLIFPHHEAEIAQMEAASGKKPLVRYWMHTGFLNVGGEKMSKSLGNFTTIRDMLKEYDAQAFRLFVLLSHYSSAIDFSPDALNQAHRSLERLQKAARIITESIETEDEEDRDLGTIEDSDPAVAAAGAQFLEHMDNDFNTPYALRTLFDLIRDINRRIDDGKISQKGLKEARELLLQAEEVLGLSLFSPAVMAGEKAEVDIATKLAETLIWTRQRLRNKKDWQIADEIRTRMKELGIAVEDT